MSAVQQNRLDVVKSLGQYSNSFSIQNKQGNTALHHAVQNPNLDIGILNELKVCLVTVDNTDGQGLTSLQHAVLQEAVNLDVVSFLVSQGASPMKGSKTSVGTSMTIAENKNPKNERLIEILQQAPYKSVEERIVDAQEFPLHYAILNGQEVKFGIQKNYDIM